MIFYKEKKKPSFVKGSNETLSPGLKLTTITGIIQHCTAVSANGKDKKNKFKKIRTGKEE